MENAKSGYFYDYCDIIIVACLFVYCFRFYLTARPSFFIAWPKK